MKTVLKCVNCSKPTTDYVTAAGFIICKPCNDVGRNLEQMLKQGIVVEYSDGTKKTLTPPKS